MSTKIDLNIWFEDQKTWINKLEEAKQALENRMHDLSKHNAYAKEHLAKRIRSGETTGDALTDEIVLLYGLDEVIIEKILAWNERMIKGKEILVAVHRKDYDCNEMISHSGRENEHIPTATGYIFGLLSGKGLVIKRNSEQSPSNIELILPVNRYVKWKFERANENTVTPVEDPLVIGGDFGGLSSMDLLLSLIKETLPREIRERNECLPPDPQVFIDSEIPGLGDDPDLYKFSDAFEHGRHLIQLATPVEAYTGLDI